MDQEWNVGSVVASKQHIENDYVGGSVERAEEAGGGGKGEAAARAPERG
jgi:hypothetical protein